MFSCHQKTLVGVHRGILPFGSRMWAPSTILEGKGLTEQQVGHPAMQVIGHDHLATHDEASVDCPNLITVTSIGR